MQAIGNALFECTWEPIKVNKLKEIQHKANKIPFADAACCLKSASDSATIIGKIRPAR